MEGVISYIQQNGQLILPVSVLQAIFDSDNSKTLDLILNELRAQIGQAGGGKVKGIESVIDQGFFICDENGNIFFKVDENGVDAVQLGGNLKQIITSLINEKIADIKPVQDYSNTEIEVGTLEIEGKSHTLYSKTFNLEWLPLDLDEEHTYTLSDDILGYNMFLSVDKLSVSGGIPCSNSAFFLQKYKVVSVFVSPQGKTQVKIKCIEQVTETDNLTATLTLQYVKPYGDTIELEVTFGAAQDASQVNVSFPYLLFNKQAQHTYTYDDNNAYALDAYVYTSGHRFFDPRSYEQQTGKRYVWHRNMRWDGNALPITGRETPCFYTDGVGTDRRPTYNIAVWWGGRNKDGTLEIYRNGHAMLPDLTADDYEYLTDFGNRLCLHDVWDYDAGFNRVDAKDTAQLRTFIDQWARMGEQLIGAPAIAMIEPGGNDRYCVAAMSGTPVRMITRQGPKYLPNDPFLGRNLSITNLVWMQDQMNLSLQNGKWLIRHFDYPLNDLKTEIETIINSNTPTDKKFVGNGTHADYGKGLTNMKALTDRFGKVGEDNVWFCTMEELYEYLWIRNTAMIQETNQGNVKRIKLHIPTFYGQRSKEFSLLFSGVSDMIDIRVTASDNVYHLTKGIEKISNNLMVNVDYSDANYTAAKKYLRLCIDNIEYHMPDAVEYAFDCRYLCSLLREDLAAPILAELPNI